MINGERVLDHPIRWAMVGGAVAARLAIYIGAQLFVTVPLNWWPVPLISTLSGAKISACS